MTKKKNVSASGKQRVKFAPSLAAGLLAALFGLPRWTRVFVCAVFALAVTLVISPIVDRIYLTYFFSMETRIVPSLVTVTFGAVMYALGWWLMVSPDPDEQAAQWMIFWYVGLGMLALLLTIVLAVIGYMIGNEPT